MRDPGLQDDELSSGEAPTIEALLDALADKDGGARRAAVEQLCQLRDPRALKPLIRALTDPHPPVRKAAAEALGTLGDAAAVEPLIEVLGQHGRDARKAAAEALAKLGEPQWAQWSNEDSDQPDLLGLARSGDKRALKALVRAFRGQSDPDARRAAAEAMLVLRAASADAASAGIPALAQADDKDISSDEQSILIGTCPNPACARRLKVPAEYLGCRARCQACGQIVHISPEARSGGD